MHSNLVKWTNSDSREAGLDLHMHAEASQQAGGRLDSVQILGLMYLNNT